MFTGIIEEQGLVSKIIENNTGKQLTISASKVVEDMHDGESICINGVCLTITHFNKKSFQLDLVTETLEKSNLGELLTGEFVNLERAITMNTRLGGHIIQGHIETIGVLVEKKADGDGAILSIGIDPAFMRYCIPKGSIAVDGISLTIASFSENIIKIALIPFTLSATTLGMKDVGDSVNIETDIIGKYIERLMSCEDEQIDELLFQHMKKWEFGES